MYVVARRASPTRKRIDTTLQTRRRRAGPQHYASSLRRQSAAPASAVLCQARSMFLRLLSAPETGVHNFKHRVRRQRARSCERGMTAHGRAVGLGHVAERECARERGSEGARERECQGEWERAESEAMRGAGRRFFTHLNGLQVCRPGALRTLWYAAGGESFGYQLRRSPAWWQMP